MKLPLPEPLPDDPLPLVARWLDEAAAAERNATAATLATVGPDGRPTARMIICRGFDQEAGWFVFYTDRGSPKGRALAGRPHAALVFHWDSLERQVRVEGPVTLTADAESDAYWRGRPADARLAALASAQSQPIDSRATLVARVAEAARQHGDDPPRPERWGGYRVWAERLELWVGQPARIHDRALWTRRLEPAGVGYTASTWQATRLMP